MISRHLALSVRLGGKRRPCLAHFVKAAFAVVWWSVCAVWPAAPPTFAAETPVDFDILIRNGTVIDGSGTAGSKADVGILHGRIAAVGDLRTARGRHVVDAGGQVVCPGFVDLHSHADRGILEFPDAENYIRQGVTSLVCGNCGSSPTDVVGFFRRLRRSGSGPNIVLLIGHGSVRKAVLDTRNAPPTADELDRMRKLVRQAMEAGAVGMSTGLRYGPGAYAQTGEVSALAKELVPFGGFYATHMRDEGTKIVQALEEALQIGREAGTAVHVSHHKISSASVFGLTRQTLARIDAARRDGQDVTLDQYPYGAGSGGMGLYVPQASLSGGLPAFRERVADPNQRREIIKAIEELLVRKLYEADQRPDDPRHTSLALARVQVARWTANPKFEGSNLTQILKSRGKPVTIRQGALLLLELVSDGAVGINHTLQDQPGGDVDRVMTHPLTAVASDGSVFKFGQGNPHPRSYGCYPRLLGYYVRERRLMTLPWAIHKMTSLPARRLGWSDRGLVKPGYWADLVVFDPDVIADLATFTDPHQHSVGVEHVLVRGRFVLRSARMTGSRPGRPIASVPVARSARTRVRRDLLEMLQSHEGRFGLYVTLPGEQAELAVNADDVFRIDGSAEAAIEISSISMRRLTQSLKAAGRSDFQTADAPTGAAGNVDSARFLMYRGVLLDGKRQASVTLAYDGLSSDGLRAVTQDVSKKIVARVQQFLAETRATGG